MSRYSPPPLSVSATSEALRSLGIDRVRLQQAWADAEGRLGSLIKQEKHAERRLRELRVLPQIRQLCDRSITRVGAFVNLVSIPSACALILAHLAGLSVLHQVLSAVAGAIPAIAWGMKLFIPPDSEISKQIDGLERELAHLPSAIRRARREAGEARSSYEETDAAYQRLWARFNSRIGKLRAIDWAVLTGIPFENFLADVFAEHGYTVETTKVTGDQGVDLIVSKDGRRIAIQAKGYPSSTVGNKAVQEAHTGMVFYRCHACAVITNSTFTSSAVELADRVGCLLIDKSKIPALIEGRVSL